jgi:hypothetical protein
VELVSKSGFDFSSDFSKGGGMGGSFEGFQERLALAGGNVELARRLVRDIGLDDMFYLLTKWLDSDLGKLAS